MLVDIFDEGRVHQPASRDELVTRGLACKAAMSSGQDTGVLDPFLLLAVAPCSVGVETAGGVMRTLLRRNVTVPAKKSCRMTTYTDNQTSVAIKVYEGERTMTRDCTLLGTFVLDGIPPLPRSQPVVEVTFDMDGECELCVSAEELSTGNKGEIIISEESYVSDPQLILHEY